MFCALIKFLQYFKNLKQELFALPPPVTRVGGGKTTPPVLRSRKWCKGVIGAQNMLIYFRLHCLYI